MLKFQRHSCLSISKTLLIKRMQKCIVSPVTILYLLVVFLSIYTLKRLLVDHVRFVRDFSHFSYFWHILNDEFEEFYSIFRKQYSKFWDCNMLKTICELFTHLFICKFAYICISCKSLSNYYIFKPSTEGTGLKAK